MMKNRAGCLTLAGFIVSLLAVVYYALSTFIQYSQYQFSGSLWSWTFCALAVLASDVCWQTYQQIKHPGQIRPDTIYQDLSEEDQASWYPETKGGEEHGSD